MNRGITNALRDVAARVASSRRGSGAALPHTRFVIFGQGRTGSSLLRSLLNTHPDVRCEGEILAEHVAQPLQLVESYALASPRPVFGFKVKIYQLSDTQHVDPAAFLGELVGAGYRIIYLRRNNLLRHAISNSFAEMRGTYHDHSAGPRPALTVDPAALIEVMGRRQAHLDREAAVLAPYEYVQVDYEADLLRPECHQPTADRVFRALDLDPVTVATDLSRSVSGDLTQRIANYADLEKALEGTPFSRFLEDPSYR